MRFKHGDLAVIVQDFVGCEGNLGIIVQVFGPPTKHPDCEHLCWQIMPVGRRKLWLVGDGKPAAYEFISEKNQALHPDPWLEPVSKSVSSPSAGKRKPQFWLDDMGKALPERGNDPEADEVDSEGVYTVVATFVPSRIRS